MVILERFIDVSHDGAVYEITVYSLDDDSSDEPEDIECGD